MDFILISRMTLTAAYSNPAPAIQRRLMAARALNYPKIAAPYQGAAR